MRDAILVAELKFIIWRSIWWNIGDLALHNMEKEGGGNVNTELCEVHIQQSHGRHDTYRSVNHHQKPEWKAKEYETADVGSRRWGGTTILIRFVNRDLVIARHDTWSKQGNWLDVNRRYSSEFKKLKRNRTFSCILKAISPPFPSSFFFSLQPIHYSS